MAPKKPSNGARRPHPQRLWGGPSPVSPTRRFIGTSRPANVPLMEPMVALSVSSMLFAGIFVATQPQGSMVERERPAMLPYPVALKAQRG